MARHRKIDVRMWGDSKFRSLSKPQPNGQSLWLYLLTGPHTTSIPGIFTAGEAAMSEALGWTLKGFREAFAEANSRQMVEADWTHRIVWIPKAIFYNQPESKNVIKSWRPYWDELPECALKAKAYQYLKAFLEGIGEGWSSCFTTTCENPSPNQEQEQEQDKKKIYTKEKAQRPSIKEVEAYCLERNNGIDAQAFLDFYEANGWVQGKSRKPIKNWRACVRTWERSGNAEGPRPATPAELASYNPVTGAGGGR